MKGLLVLVLFFAATIPVLSQNRVENEVLVYGTVKFENTYYSNGKLATSGETSKDAVILAIDKEGNKHTTNSDEKGNYELRLPKGEYQIQAYLPTGFSLEIASQKSNLVLNKRKVKLNLILLSGSCG